MWYLSEYQEKGETVMELQPEVASQAALFLFDIGRWAASELKERWTLARKKTSARQTTEVDLSKSKEEIKQQAETLLRDVATDHGVADVERVLRLIERKGNLIWEWKEGKVANDEEYNRQLITRSAYQLRQQELDQKIADTLVEIETDLKELGVQVKKEVADQSAS
jgi:hypothetical protein